MATLKNKLTALVDSVALKLNEQNANKEDKTNKKSNLLSTSEAEYPSVPAVKAGLTATLTDAKNYTDAEFAKYPNIVSDALYVRTDNNYTNAEKQKLATIEGSKFKGQYTTLTALQTAHPSPEIGSYAFVDGGVGEVVAKYIWDSSDGVWVLQQGESGDMSPAQIKSAYESNADTNAFTDAEKTNVATNTTHRGLTNNPHNTTKAQVGLSNVDNTSDVNKPVSNAQQTAISAVQNNLDTYKIEVGTNFPDYAAQFNATINF